MTQLIDALRSKYRTPQAAIRALGLDEALLREGAAMKPDAPLAKAVKAGLKELLGQDASLMDVMQFIDALKAANPESGGAEPSEGGKPPGDVPPEETDQEYDHEDDAEDEDMMTTAPNSGLPMAGGGKKKAQDNDLDGFQGGDIATDNPAAKLHSLLAEHLPPEVMAQVGEILASIAGEAEMGEEDVAGGEPTEDEHPDEVKEKEKEEKKEMKAAMDAVIDARVQAGLAAGRANDRAINDALREVRPVVGELAMAFDSAGDVYRQALKMRGVDAGKIKDPEALSLLWSNLPKPGAMAPRYAVAMDADTGGSLSKMFANADRLAA